MSDSACRFRSASMSAAAGPRRNPCAWRTDALRLVHDHGYTRKHRTLCPDHQRSLAILGYAIVTEATAVTIELVAGLGYHAPREEIEAARYDVASSVYAEYHPT